ncbi:hypothetical protein [Streptomyces olivaceoviridis]|uniref:hypothetical protein n=2 Tax=Streptomyces olivaceoviridis TaxID=1921 RepID=UPI0036B84306
MARRTGAVAGVNGDYVEIHASGRPLGGIVSDGHMLKSPKPGFASQLGVRPEGTMVMGPETFSGTVTAGSATRSLTSVNTVNDVSTGGITEITPDLGETPDLAKPSTLVAPADQGGISHSGLVRIGDDGGLQYTVEPALASITVHGPKDPVAKGEHIALSATGEQIGGDTHRGTVTVSVTAGGVTGRTGVVVR